MNRWGYRIAGILMIIVFLLVFWQMHRTLLMLQQNQPGPVTTT